jgi:two-component system sensor histidine kinase UhpB
MRGDNKILDLQKERAYLSAQLEEVTKELARLDLRNLILTREKKQAFTAFNFIKIIQEKIESAFTLDDLYLDVVKAITDDLCMDSAALLKINRITRDIFILSSSGLPKNRKLLKIDGGIPDQEIFKPTFVNSKCSLQTFHKFIINSFKHPFFIWYPIENEDDGTLVLFAGNTFEDLMSKQPFSETSLEAFGAISSVVLLSKDNIAKTMEMIRRKEERIDFLAEILKTSPIAVLATDWNAKITYVNPAMENLYGYKPEDLMGKDPGMLNAEPNAPEIQENIVDTVKQGKVWRGEIVNKKKDEELFYIHASIYPVQDKEKNFIAFVGFHEDITKRKQAEHALQESERKYRDLVNNAPVGIYRTNLKGDILFVNKALCRILEFDSPEEMMAENVLSSYKEPDNRKILIKLLKETNKVENFEVTVITKTGKMKDVLISAFLNGDILSGMILDITERKQVEQEREYLFRQVRLNQDHLQNLSRRLIEAQETDHRSIAGEIHDQIGQNLTALSINLNIMNSYFLGTVDRQITNRLEDSLKLVEETMERIRNVLADLRPPVLDDYGLGVALRWYIKRFSERTGVATILQEEELLPRPPLSLETAIFRIVQEVLTNVAKHAQASQVNILLERTNGIIHLAIADDGVGFDPTDVRKLKEQPQWGLITIEERAKALGGHISVESMPGKGTRVIVQVPC